MPRLLLRDLFYCTVKFGEGLFKIG